MAYNDFISLNNKKYKVYQEGYAPAHNRLRTHTLSLTRKTIIQDFGAAPQQWSLKLKVYINDPPTSEWGHWNDLLAAFNDVDGVAFEEHDDSNTATVIVDGPLLRLPHIAANIAGYCNGVFDVDIKLTEVLS